MVNLSLEELAAAVEAVREAPVLPPSLQPKFEGALKENNLTNRLEINEEEAEVILDNLLPPQESSAAINSLRLKLSQFVSQRQN